jgi:hypothetical protein
MNLNRKDLDTLGEKKTREKREREREEEKRCSIYK